MALFIRIILYSVQSLSDCSENSLELAWHTAIIVQLSSWLCGLSFPYLHLPLCRLCWWGLPSAAVLICLWFCRFFCCADCGLLLLFFSALLAELWPLAILIDWFSGRELTESEADSISRAFSWSWRNRERGGWWWWWRVGRETSVRESKKEWASQADFCFNCASSPLKGFFFNYFIHLYSGVCICVCRVIPESLSLRRERLGSLIWTLNSIWNQKWPYLLS